MTNMDEEGYNLFVYGSLRDSRVFQSVSGLSFTLDAAKVRKDRLLAEPAMLAEYRSVSPDNVYFYAVKNPSSKIEGLVVYGVPAPAMAEIDKYEGKRYDREAVQINTAKGPVWAQAYLVSHEAMKKHFGDRWHVNLIHELWLRKRIEEFLKKKTRPGDQTDDADIERIADRELLATTERDLVITHYHKDAVSDYYLEHELDRPRRSIRYLYGDGEARPFIKQYLGLVVKQVLLNQLDEKIQTEFRFELEHIRSSERYFKRSVSLLAALRMINANSHSVDLIIKQCLDSMPYEKSDLIDYVKYAVRAAQSVFEYRIARDQLEYIRSHFNPGLIPLGVELEFSNLGSAAVEPQRSVKKKTDSVYDGFKYFSDFCLDVLSWKLGGYVDDHTGSTSLQRRCGFFELAPGRLNIEGELSRPATAAPWILNQLINEIVKFYDIKPHSLHLSFQLRKNQIGRQKILPLSFVKCLLALGGGPELKQTGRLWVSRMGYDEIKQYRGGEELVFTRTSKRQWYVADDSVAEKTPAQATTYVQQYKFIRLQQRANYEPLIVCLKGLQLGYNPADYLTAEQLRKSRKLQREYEELKKWSNEPTEISPQAIRRFLEVVKQGLLNEAHHRPAHKLHYIDWAISTINVQLRMFNQQIKKSKSKN